MDIPIIRISFYNSKMKELSYWRQYHDYIFEENKDYIHLVYDFNYDTEITPSMYNKIKNDITDIYNTLEKNPSVYQEMINHCKKKQLYLTLNSSLKYLYHLIENYTKHILK